MRPTDARTAFCVAVEAMFRAIASKAELTGERLNEQALAAPAESAVRNPAPWSQTTTRVYRVCPFHIRDRHSDRH